MLFLTEIAVIAFF